MGLLGELAREGVFGPVVPFVNTDDRDPDRYVVYLEQARLACPTSPTTASRSTPPCFEAYTPHVARMLELAGTSARRGRRARRRARDPPRVPPLDKVTNRDPVKTYTLVDRAGLDALAPGIDWDAFLAGMQAPARTFSAVVVRQPGYLTALGEAAAARAVEAWRDWLAWHVVHAHAPYLSSPSSRRTSTSTGAPSRASRGCGTAGTRRLPRRGRARRGRRAALRRAPLPAARQGADARARRQRRRGLPAEPVRGPVDGAGDAGRGARQARGLHPEDRLPRPLARLHRAPGRGRRPARQRQAGQRLRGRAQPRQARRPGRPHRVVHDPADGQRLLQPGDERDRLPRGDPPAPVLRRRRRRRGQLRRHRRGHRHEIGHGFDDSGSQFDGRGELRDWWTAEDRERFQALADALIGQFSVLETRDAPARRSTAR